MAYLFQAHFSGGGGGGLIAIVSVVHKELEYKVEKLKNEMGRGPVSK